MFPAINSPSDSATRDHEADDVCRADCSGVFIMMSRDESDQFTFGQLIALAIGTLVLAIVVILTFPVRAAQDKVSTPASTNSPFRGGFGNGKALAGEDTAETGTGRSEVLRRFQLIKQAVPGIARVGVLWQPETDGEHTKGMLQDIGKAASATDLSILFVPASDPAQLDTALSEINSGQVDAVIVMPSAMLFADRKYIIDLIQKIHLPAIYSTREFVQDGGLMSYGPSLINIERRKTPHIDREAGPIASFPDLGLAPSLVINLRAARQLGIAFSPEFLMLVDEIVP
jgi:hypothetical protein